MMCNLSCSIMNSQLDTERQNDLATITEVWINNPKV